MVTPNNEKTAVNETFIHEPVKDLNVDIPFPFTVGNYQKQLFLHNHFITHPVKSGLNPLVDAAAHLFSTIGKLKNYKSEPNYAKLQQDLIAEINLFQETAKAQGYSTEYVLVSRYALCATLDDIISNTVWGNEGRWENFSIIACFNQEATREDRFFLILERIIKDPALYIDVMELMYICLSLGFKGSYRLQETGNTEIETISHSLYKHIRAYHGDFSKNLSPFPLKNHASVKLQPPKTSYWFIFFITASIIMLLFVGLGFLLENISNQAYQELMHIGKSILYESSNF